MAFPTTVSASFSSAETPGKYGSFERSGALYQILTTRTDAGARAFLCAMKSTDGGVTWNEMDSGNRPEVFVLDADTPVPYTSCQSLTNPNEIYTLYSDNLNTGGVGIIMFDTDAPDAWGTILGASTPPDGSYPVQSANGFYVAAHRASDDKIVFAIPGDSVTGIDGVLHRITCYNTFDIAGSAWGGAWTPLDFSDYATTIDWDQVPCGIKLGSDGKITFYTQQITREVSPVPVQTIFTVDGSFTPPWNCPSVDVEATGPGGGGGVGVGTGGGGGGGNSDGTVVVIPGNLYAVTVGLGGAAGLPGSGPSTFETVSAGPGDGGGVTGGAGGTGDRAGGDGGDPGNDTGGGGGGSASSTAVGGDGGDGDPVTVFGGAGGTGQGAGGAGGNRGAADPPNKGGNGNAPGGGGGGQGSADEGPNDATGAAGQVVITYTAVQGTVYPSRLWQQSLDAADTLGTLTEIAQGQFPIQGGLQPVLPMPFDCGAGLGFAAIAFSGADATTNENIMVGRATNADPLVFVFESFSAGNSGSGVNPSPALSVLGSTVFCAYHAAPAPPTAEFLYRADTGSGFGAPISYGSTAAAFSRLQAYFSSLRSITFGTATPASTSYDTPA